MENVDYSDNDLHSRMVALGFQPTSVDYAADAYRAASERKNPHSTENLHVLGNWSKDGPQGVVNTSLIVNGPNARLVVLPVDPSDDIRNKRGHLARVPASFPVWQLDSEVKLVVALGGAASPVAQALQVNVAAPQHVQTPAPFWKAKPTAGPGLGL